MLARSAAEMGDRYQQSLIRDQTKLIRGQTCFSRSYGEKGRSKEGERNQARTEGRKEESEEERKEGRTEGMKTGSKGRKSKTF